MEGVAAWIVSGTGMIAKGQKGRTVARDRRYSLVRHEGACVVLRACGVARAG